MWGDQNIIRFTEQELSNFKLSTSIKDFILLNGMPPEYGELTFNNIKDLLKESKQQDHYLKIGTNGSGDFVVFNIIKDCELGYLNHDNYDEYIFINSSLKQLILVSDIVWEFEGALTPINEEAAFNTEFTDESYSRVLDKVKEIDKYVLEEEGSYWRVYLETLLWERNEERNS